MYVDDARWVEIVQSEKMTKRIFFSLCDGASFVTNLGVT